MQLFKKAETGVNKVHCVTFAIKKISDFPNELKLGISLIMQCIPFKDDLCILKSEICEGVYCKANIVCFCHHADFSLSAVHFVNMSMKTLG